jgi:hypothetical protein
VSFEVPLARMQRWMQAVVVHPGSTEDALAAPAAAAEISSERVGDVILPSKTLDPVERLGVYHGMYLLRMHDALASDYEALKHFLGDRRFFGLVSDYVQAYPSRSYSLNRLGDHLPEFLQNVEGLRRRDFCVALARLEQAVAQVFDAPETPALSEVAIAAVPAEAWERARLKPITAFRLLAFRYPVNAYLQTVRDEDHAHHPKAKLKNEWVAVYRRQFAVYRLDLTRDAHDLLQDLASGARLGDAIAAALASDRKRSLTPNELSRWFREWVSGGVFQSVEVD